jgi:hypothetical protein
MYRRPKFLEILIDIRQEMSREVDYDVDLFAEMIRTSSIKKQKSTGHRTEEFDAQTEESVLDDNQNEPLKLFGFKTWSQ